MCGICILFESNIFFYYLASFVTLIQKSDKISLICSPFEDGSQILCAPYRIINQGPCYDPLHWAESGHMASVGEVGTADGAERIFSHHPAGLDTGAVVEILHCHIADTHTNAFLFPAFQK